MKRFVTLPAIGKAVPLGAYVAAVKRAKAEPETEFKTGLTTWWPTTGAEIMRQFWAGVEARITEGKSYSERGIA